jgi:hypothetical protein
MWEAAQIAQAAGLRFLAGIEGERESSPGMCRDGDGSAFRFSDPVPLDGPPASCSNAC